MNSRYVKVFLGGVAIAVLVGGVYALTNIGNIAEASRYTLRDGDVISVGESLNSSRQITNAQNVQMLFDERENSLLIGRGVGTQHKESEGVRTTKLHILDPKTGLVSDVLTERAVIEAVFNSTGGMVYFVTPTMEVYQYDVQNHDEKLIVKKAFEIELSPDDTLLAFHRLNDDWQPGDYYEKALGIGVYDLKRNTETLVTEGWDHFAPHWTPNGKNILYAAANENGIVSQFVVELQSKKQEQLTNIHEKEMTERTIGYLNGKISWSSNGSSVVAEGDSEIWLYEFDSEFKTARGKKLAYGKSPRFVDNETISVLATASGSESGLILIDKNGNLKK